VSPNEPSTGRAGELPKIAGRRDVRAILGERHLLAVLIDIEAGLSAAPLAKLIAEDSPRPRDPLSQAHALDPAVAFVRPEEMRPVPELSANEYGSNSRPGKPPRT